MAPVQARREKRLAESKQHMLQREDRIANLDLWRAGPRASAEPLRVLSISPSSSQRGGWHYLHPGQAGAGAAPALEESMLTGGHQTRQVLRHGKCTPAVNKSRRSISSFKAAIFPGP